VVGEELEGTTSRMGRRSAGAAGISRTWAISVPFPLFFNRWMWVSPSVAMAMTRPLRAVTS
jgi:hypothetical protein